MKRFALATTVMVAAAALVLTGCSGERGGGTTEPSGEAEAGFAADATIGVALPAHAQLLGGGGSIGGGIGGTVNSTVGRVGGDIGGGVRGSKLLASGAELAALPGAEVLDLTIPAA